MSSSRNRWVYIEVTWHFKLHTGRRRPTNHVSASDLIELILIQSQLLQFHLWRSFHPLQYQVGSLQNVGMFKGGEYLCTPLHLVWCTDFGYFHLTPIRDKPGAISVGFFFYCVSVGAELRPVIVWPILMNCISEGKGDNQPLGLVTRVYSSANACTFSSIPAFNMFHQHHFWERTENVIVTFTAATVQLAHSRDHSGRADMSRDSPLLRTRTEWLITLSMSAVLPKSCPSVNSFKSTTVQKSFSDIPDCPFKFK